MNSALMMTERKIPGRNGNGVDSHGAVINALRRLYDPVLEEPIPEALLRAVTMTREEANAALEGDDKESADSSHPSQSDSGGTEPGKN